MKPFREQLAAILNRAATPKRDYELTQILLEESRDMAEARRRAPGPDVQHAADQPDIPF